MSSTNREDNSDPERNLTPSELDDLNRLEAIAQRRLGSYLLVGNALGEIRDRHLYRGSHASFETYVRERWGLNVPNGEPLSQTAIPADGRATPTVEQEPHPALRNKSCEALARACDQTLSALDGSVGEDLLPTLRWLLTQATGTIGEVSSQLESRAADIDDGARARLRDDVLVLDGELAIVKALLIELHDWDFELRRLLKDELPPFDADPDPEDDE